MIGIFFCLQMFAYMIAWLIVLFDSLPAVIGIPPDHGPSFHEGQVTPSGGAESSSSDSAEDGADDDLGHWTDPEDFPVASTTTEPPEVAEHYSRVHRRTHSNSSSSDTEPPMQLRQRRTAETKRRKGKSPVSLREEPELIVSASSSQKIAKPTPPMPEGTSVHQSEPQSPLQPQPQPQSQSQQPQSQSQPQPQPQPQPLATQQPAQALQPPSDTSNPSTGSSTQVSHS